MYIVILSSQSSFSASKPASLRVAQCKVVYHHHDDWIRNTRSALQSHLVANPSNSITEFAIVVFVQAHVLGCFIERATGTEATAAPFPASTATLLETLGLTLRNGIVFRVRIRPIPSSPPNSFPFIAEPGTFILWAACFLWDYADEHSQEHHNQDGEACAFHHHRERCLFG